MHWGWLYDGVNASVPRNAGPECANFSTNKVKLFESIFHIIVCLYMIRWGLKNLTPLKTWQPMRQYYTGKHVLLVAMTFVFGMELGFKFASRSVIYILNPCHITTIIQVSHLLLN